MTLQIPQTGFRDSLPFNPEFFPDRKISKSYAISDPLKQTIIIFTNFDGKVGENVSFMFGHNCDRWDVVSLLFLYL